MRNSFYIPATVGKFVRKTLFLETMHVRNRLLEYSALTVQVKIKVTSDLCLNSIVKPETAHETMWLPLQQVVLPILSHATYERTNTGATLAVWSIQQLYHRQTEE